MQTLSNFEPGGEAWAPESDEGRDAVREQLGRLLASSVFRKSKGCSNLLTYIVNRTLEGDAPQLKERTIGIEVFGRAPDYDTAADHVVRSTAGEVRKRLAQYYMEPGRSREIRIDVPPGSYLSRFSRSAAFPAEPLESDDFVTGSKPGLLVRLGFGRLRSRLTVVLIALAAAAVFGGLWARSEFGPSAGRTLTGFWQPVLASPNPVLMCIGTREAAQAAEAGPPGPLVNQTALPFLPGTIRGSSTVYLDDAMALSRLAGWLQQNRKPYRILLPSRVTFADLQTSPAVLIGFNNYWTTSLAGRFRFTMERGNTPDIRILRDKKNPSRNDWSVDVSTPYDRTFTDYALVVRAVDPKTGQTVVSAAGLTHFSTLAASEFLTDPNLLKKLDAFGARGWERKNMATVLSTEVIQGSPGSPKIVVADFW